MSLNVSTGSTSIPYGSTLRIGYRISGSTSAFTYIAPYPGFDDLPYVYTLPLAGTYEIQYTVVCPSCSLPEYSLSETTTVTVT